MTLQHLLTYARPGRSRAEKKFIRRYIKPRGARPDLFGNLIVRVGENPKVLWSCHTDTVHRLSGRQEVLVENGVAFVRTTDFLANCLGADCTTGVWLMLQMIDAGKPGLYIFHRDEETGCRGSNWIARNTPELLDGVRYAIAFDRRGYDSIVTHQVGVRTASDEFARALAAGLGLDMKPDPTGVFTDTIEYEALIPECTNVSVGYENAHSRHEVQDLAFAELLLQRLLDLDVDALPVVRNPAAPQKDPWWETDDLWGDMSKYKTSRQDGPTCWECELDDDAVCPECKYTKTARKRPDLLCAYCDADLDPHSVDAYFIGEYEICRECYLNNKTGV